MQIKTGINYQANEKKALRTQPNKPKLADWNGFGDILYRLAQNRTPTIKRHAKGLLDALKL